MLRRNGPPGWVTPMFPNTVELLLKAILPWLEAAVDTAGGTVARAVLLVKMSVCGPPTTPTLRVPVVPEADISTPFSTPVAFNGMMPGPTACCRCAKLAGDWAAIAAAKDRRKSRRLIYAVPPMDISRSAQGSEATIGS